VRPLVVSHAARADNPNQFIFGLLPHRPADVRPVCVFLVDGSGLQAMRQLGVEATALPAGRTREVRRMAAVIRALGRRIRRLDADVADVQTSMEEVVSRPPTAHRGAIA
jgi:hypothetical protein